jgi:hypothetical protein
MTHADRPRCRAADTTSAVPPNPPDGSPSHTVRTSSTLDSRYSLAAMWDSRREVSRHHLYGLGRHQQRIIAGEIVRFDLRSIVGRCQDDPQVSPDVQYRLSEKLISATSKTSYTDYFTERILQ